MMTYETIESYSGVTRRQIRRGLTVLAVVGVVHVDRVRTATPASTGLPVPIGLHTLTPTGTWALSAAAEIPTPVQPRSSPTGFALIPRR